MVGILAIACLVKAYVTSQPPPPVAIMSQHDDTNQILPTSNQLDTFQGIGSRECQLNLANVKLYPASGADAEVKNNHLPCSLKKVGEYGKTIYNMAKVGKWREVTADLLSLKEVAKGLSSEIKGNKVQLARLNSSITKLDQAIASQNRQVAMDDANRITLVAAKMSIGFQMHVPVEVMLLSYYGWELEIWAQMGNPAWLHKTAKNLRHSSDVLRPTVLASGGTALGQRFEVLVADVEKASLPSQYSRLAALILDEVDNLERIF
ncbi:hypothetical protein [Cylindrospermum sp. FACHB-282]|uniref:hypothetical protein n=1 Tax=Cylindrospermum sp. FACHB-282 TaxID=2692794 RepID=UPI001686B993|nr:hypothetical protein [Cylindrospermum sp. FACHB-282]MBD2385553.1 hypothetical protein [Cylindrospermum sp. FACHB-282]